MTYLNHTMNKDNIIKVSNILFDLYNSDNQDVKDFAFRTINNSANLNGIFHTDYLYNNPHQILGIMKDNCNDKTWGFACPKARAIVRKIYRKYNNV